MSPAPPPDWSTFAWPRTYRAGGPGAAVHYLLGAGLTAGGVFALRYLLRMHAPTAGQVGTFAAFGAVFVALGVLAIVDTLRTRYTLSRDAIEYASLLSRASLRRDEIAGFVVWVSSGLRVYRLLPSAAGRKHIDLMPFGLVADDALFAWIHSLPDLAAVAARAEAPPDPARARRLALAGRVALALNAATTALCFWTLAGRSHFFLSATLCALLPWALLAIAARAPTMFSVGAVPDGERSVLALPFVGAGATLMVCTTERFHLLHWTQAIGPSVVALCVLMIAHDLATRGQKVGPAERAVVAAMGATWAIGAVMLANAALDQRVPWAFTRVAVVARHVSRGERPSYSLSLDPSGPLREHNEVTVYRALYEASPVGASVCVGLRPGGLRLRRYCVTPTPCLDEPRARR